MVFRKKPNARTERFELRMLPDELTEVAEKARMAGLSTSEFIRRCALGRRVAVRYDSDVILSLRALVTTVGSLRDSVKDDPARFDPEDFRKIAAECIETMQRMV